MNYEFGTIKEILGTFEENSMVILKSISLL